LNGYARRFTSENLGVTSRVNEGVSQNDTTVSMMILIVLIIEYLSTSSTLELADFIVTATRNGAGARFDSPVFLCSGNLIEVDVEGIGKLSNGVIEQKVLANERVPQILAYVAVEGA
jgi:2-keto-4-pentenoate hydratase/2-oxohepta-3-ene-1,7-dioic acid hydratase in catechol pathway